MKGDYVDVTTTHGDMAETVRVEADKAGRSVHWKDDRRWVEVTVETRTEKVVRRCKFATEHVLSVVEHKVRPEEE